MVEARAAAEILNQALPYIQRFQGHTFVVKYGGSSLADRDALRGVIRNVLLLQLVGIRPVLVHGGGPEIDSLLARLGMKSEAVGGLRVTDDATMEVVEMALSKANKAVVGEIHACGGKAVGLPSLNQSLRTVREGVRGTRMAAWTGRLSEAEIVAVASYVRRFFQPERAR
jgi:acetylglutamate kinase